MNVGSAWIKIRLFGLTSIKEKRSISKRLINQIRKSHNVSVSEVDAQDSKDFLILGISMVSNDKNLIHRTFEMIENLIEYGEGLEVEEMEKEIW